MSVKKLALFGSKEALLQARVKTLRQALDKLGHEVIVLPSPHVLKSFTKWQEIQFDWVLYLGEPTKNNEDISEWKSVFAQLKEAPLTAAWTFEEMGADMAAQMRPDFAFSSEEGVGDVLQSLGLKGATNIKSEHFLSDVDLSLVELSEKLSEEEISGLNTGAFLEDGSAAAMFSLEPSQEGEDIEFQPMEPHVEGSAGNPAEEGSFQEEEQANELAFLSSEKTGAAKFDNLDDLLASDAGDDDDPLALSGVTELESGVAQKDEEIVDDGLGFLEAIDQELKKDTGGDFLKRDESLVSHEEPSEFWGESQSKKEQSFLEDAPVEEEEHSLKAKETPSVRFEGNTHFEELKASGSPQAEVPSFEELPHGFEKSAAESGGEIQTIKRYAALKEREAREKHASFIALKNEYEKMRQKLSKSEQERRRLTLESEEQRAKLRAREDKVEENKFQQSRLEQGFQEQMKDLQIRFESAEFKASKAERRLEEFRDRVRNDIQKIRVRERELANRLELQKRDAEALLTVKDEKLLQQKREIDRLQFESDTLRERLEEEVERSDERTKKLSRALQSLKLAQGMLSGLEDFDLPSSSSGNDDQGEAA